MSKSQITAHKLSKLQNILREVKMLMVPAAYFDGVAVKQNVQALISLTMSLGNPRF